MSQLILAGMWLGFMLALLAFARRLELRRNRRNHFNNYIVRRFGDGHPDITRR